MNPAKTAGCFENSRNCSQLTVMTFIYYSTEIFILCHTHRLTWRPEIVKVSSPPCRHWTWGRESVRTSFSRSFTNSHTPSTPQSRQSARLFLLVVGIGTPLTPHPHASVPPPPLVPGGRGTLAGERGGGRVPIPTRGHTLVVLFILFM
jgi:hypothetical protein